MTTLRLHFSGDSISLHSNWGLTPKQLGNVERVILTGCGTSWHSALIGEYLIEELARIPVSVEYASELRYRNPPIERNTLKFGLTQGGDTAGTLAALRKTKKRCIAPWLSATSLQVRLHRQPMAVCNCMQGLKSVFPVRRCTPRSAASRRCWHFTSVA